ncbi:MAG: flavin reductase [Clostridia bacterium]|nr:flavin reductase [Clostridia bacterium]
MNDMDKALFKIGYGLYVVTSNDGNKDNGLIVNSVMQLTSSPKTVAVAINKQNYSHDVIRDTKKMNVNILNTDAPFSVFKNFGFQSGRNADKFENVKSGKAQNGLQVLFENINAFLCLEVRQYVDMGSHGLFICDVTDAGVLNDKETMTYSYYQQNVKPKPQPEKKKGYVCKICGYFYEGEELPEDFVCPTCKHPASDFEKADF